MDFPGGGIVAAGDRNAHSPVWSGRAKHRSSAAPFWENLIEENSLEIQNSEMTTRYGGQCHSIIDLALSRGVGMQRAIGGKEHSPSSDHEVIIWEVSEKSKPPALEHFAGWDRSG